ncbi:caspase family protein [Labrys neptuniae]|uniref:Caspase family protein n=1 Tax=Labrys neptuniae TaxID=376174 RepID=A0ABV3PL08_9HYPH
MHPSSSAQAATTCEHRAAPAGASGKRVAVIVGNGGYGNGIPALPNPARDAEAVAKAMGALGFEVFLAGDADSAGLQNCLATAYASATGADVAMFYYSGHGIQIKDENYLVATDATSKDLQHGFVPVQPIVDTLQKGAKATLVFLDACRNNPMAEGGQAGLSVSTGRGLARVEGAGAAAAPGTVQARGLMVAYATSPNAVALDGKGELSPFTGAFVKAVGTSGYSIQRIMSDVTKAVGEETDWAQTPWMKSSLTDELKLGGGQTLAEAQSVSDNHAARAQTLLNTNGRREEAIVEALKGLPATPDETALQRFSKAYVALYAAVQSREALLPVKPGFSQVAVSTQGRVAVYQMSADYQSGDLTLWSVAEKKALASLPTKGRVSKFLFSPHGNLLVTEMDNVVTVWNGLDGARLFDLKAGGYVTSMEFSPDESRLLLGGDGSSALTVIDVASRKPVFTVKSGQLTQPGGKARGGRLVQANFGSNDTICFALDSSGDKRLLGVYDLAQKKTMRLREASNAVTVSVCDPAGKYMVRTYAVGSSEQGMEIWDLATDAVNLVKAPIANIMGIDPAGKYVGVIALDAEVQGIYDLATGKKGQPATVPPGYVIYGSRVRNAEGGLVSQDINPNAWRDWPDESLYGPGLVEKALAGLTPAQREEVARDRITFAEVAANP